MSALLKLFPGTWWIYAGVLGAAFAAGGTAAWQVQGWRLDAVQAEYDGFVSTTKALGEAAKKAATEQTARDLRAKEGADRENQTTLTALRADIKRLRNARPSGSFVPATASSAASPDRACFKRPELESALQRFDTEVAGIVETGDEARVNLDTAKKWAQK